jgi:hypothetical protein
MISGYPAISRDRYPSTIAAQRVDPLLVCDGRTKLGAQMDDFVLILEKRIESPRKRRRQIFVDQDLHANWRRFSKFTASRTTLGDTSKRYAARLIDPSAATASASDAVVAPEPAAIGCPNARVGSMTMLAFPLNGRHRATVASSISRSLKLFSMTFPRTY